MTIGNVSVVTSTAVPLINHLTEPVRVNSLLSSTSVLGWLGMLQSPPQAQSAAAIQQQLDAQNFSEPITSVAVRAGWLSAGAHALKQIEHLLLACATRMLQFPYQSLALGAESCSPHPQDPVHGPIAGAVQEYWERLVRPPLHDLLWLALQTTRMMPPDYHGFIQTLVKSYIEGTVKLALTLEPTVKQQQRVLDLIPETAVFVQQVRQMMNDMLLAAFGESLRDFYANRAHRVLEIGTGGLVIKAPREELGDILQCLPFGQWGRVARRLNTPAMESYYNAITDCGLSNREQSLRWHAPDGVLHRLSLTLQEGLLQYQIDDGPMVTLATSLAQTAELCQQKLTALRNHIERVRQTLHEQRAAAKKLERQNAARINWQIQKEKHSFGRGKP